MVHIDHGIGRYDGLKTLDVMEAPHDCLELQYGGEAKLYLPVENIDLLTRYGSETEGVQLDRLGGAAWQARKAKAKERLREMAEGLIAIAAARATHHTDDIEPPAGLFDEFCARFPYEETDDQLNAIADVLGDLGSGKPMDRLICGDVGFGKTEVALRAAFVVAMSGRQVAVVCPTTLLARQHYATFVERFQGWPVRVRRLSRLVTPAEANETREALAKGEVEIVVGTHAVLGKQVQFKDLGMVVVDEEQHFGVKHKEALKALRAEVHVLTLTATPIPRTLQLSLSGIREMSIIATPPVDRLAVRTYVAPEDPVSMREALLREKYRGGQSYFVAPRVKDLPELERFLREQVPEVKFAVGHGQMPPSQLEDVMSAFYEGRYDVLLSTTIVESGLDIPTANTLIVHRADMFGLSQLYQLRGRVGRAKARAYAYLTTPPNRTLTVSAEKRLRVLQSLDSLGAGFQLASHDLDIRGGGNLLGEEQSGHIREIGVELYQQMLEDAVVRAEEPRRSRKRQSARRPGLVAADQHRRRGPDSRGLRAGPERAPGALSPALRRREAGRPRAARRRTGRPLRPAAARGGSAAQGGGDQGPVPRGECRQDRRRAEGRGGRLPRRQLPQSRRSARLRAEERGGLEAASRPEAGGQGRVGGSRRSPRRRRADPRRTRQPRQGFGRQAAAPSLVGARSATRASAAHAPHRQARRPAQALAAEQEPILDREDRGSD